jgi:dienelactone hydrolase
MFSFIRNSLLLLALLNTPVLHAQYAARQLTFDAKSAPDLTLPKEPTPQAEASSPRMMLLKPEGDGPFPAVVLGHQCGGLVFSKTNPKAANWPMLAWARDFARQGYVTLLIDFMGPRDAQSVCQLPQNGVTFGRTTKDFLQAAEHLRSLPYVNPNQLAMVGFSQGALIAFFANSASVRHEMKQGPGFNAYVSFYPYCGYARNGPGNYAGNVVQEDLDKPHLVFTGGKDNETPAEDCEKLLTPLAQKGAPIQYQFYPEATHCWDCKSLNGFTKPGHRGQVTYLFNEEVTQDSRQKMYQFLQTKLGLQR